MWLFTDEGFLSVVSYDTKYDDTKRSKRQVKSWGASPVLVRARLEDDIEQIRPFWSKLRIEKDDSADYEFRAVVPRARFVDFMANKAFEIDYNSHFKEVARERSPGDQLLAGRRYTAMMGVWNKMAALQPDAPYSGSNWYSTYSTYGSSYSSGSGSGPLCTEWIEAKDDKNYVWRKWCNLKKGHTGDCKFTDIVKTGTTIIGGSTNSGADKSKVALNKTAVNATAYDTTNPFNMPDTVEEMCKELLVKAPDDIQVDVATPYYVYDLWARCLEEFHKPLTEEQLVDVLDELAGDELSTQEARDFYSAICHKFIDQVFDEERLDEAKDAEWSEEDDGPHASDDELRVKFGVGADYSYHFHPTPEKPVEVNASTMELTS